MGLQPLTYQLVEEWRHNESDSQEFSPTPNPAPRGGEIIRGAVFRGIRPEKPHC
ncbi:MAG: hypothetical protein KA314_07630 [Chloroflexi bacterium]|nr:hypothetical protein [Chloroflexota bacterium]MBP8055698.1 hypothetical protein [Chloroflexota bacterium]